jgi:hypothetical protein
MSNQITTLDDLPETINADTEVCIPGYALESTDDRTLWLLTDTTTEIPLRKVHVQWRADTEPACPAPHLRRGSRRQERPND